jgi:CYTH domain-containing protein
MEIERKFLVRSLPPGWKKAPNSRIRQAYFPLRGKQFEIRIREKGNEHFITIKAGRGTVRIEEETKISKNSFRNLWPLICAASVAKRRYRIAHRTKTIELDIYEGPHRGLKTADVEFSSRREADAFTPPAWFGREITGSRKYANEVLARRGHL